MKTKLLLLLVLSTLTTSTAYAYDAFEGQQKLPSGSRVEAFIDDEDNYGCMLQYFELRAYGNKAVESEMKEQCESGEITNVIKNYFRAIYGRDARCYISAIGVEVNAKAICK